VRRVGSDFSDLSFVVYSLLRFCSRVYLMESGAVTRPSLLVGLRDAENKEAWADFVRIYSRIIYGFCVQRGLQEADAADVTQEVLKTVARTIQRFEYDPSRGKFRSWLMTVTRSKFNNFLGSKQRRNEVSGGTSLLQRLDDVASPEEESNWDRELHQRLFEWASERVRSEVTPKAWEVFLGTAVEGRSGEEIASAFGLSVGAVYVAKSRVIARLRELIASVGDGPPNLEGIVRT
jgi:RNA polymerase sigma factor (sigma-70 family)